MPKISLSGPAELLTVIPFQLGFHPSRSVVVTCFHGPRVGLVARLDVITDDDPRAGGIGEAVAETLSVLLRGRPSSVALVSFEDRVGESGLLADALCDAIEADRVVVRERIVVRDGRWFDLLRPGCPAEGHAVPDPSEVPAVASFVALGHATLGSREELSRVFEPMAESDLRHDSLSAAIEDWQGRFVGAGGPCDRPGVVGGPCDGDDAAWAYDERPGGHGRLVEEVCETWADLLRGDLAGQDLEHRLPAVAGPLRDPAVRELILAWLRCDPALLESWPRDPDRAVRLLAEAVAQVGSAADRFFAATGARRDRESGGSAATLEPRDGAGPTRRPRRGRRKRGRRVQRAGAVPLSRPARLETEVGGSAGHRAGEDLGWDDWGPAAASRAVQARLEAACRLTPPAHAAPLLAVAGLFAWWCGDGARAGVAVDRAVELEPDHALSLLIREALIHGLKPPLPLTVEA